MRRAETLLRPIIGLDLSLTGTGICTLETDGTYSLRSAGYKLKRTSTVREKVERMINIVSEIVDAIDCASQTPIVSIENYAFAARGAQNDLGELHGAVKVQLRLGYAIDPSNPFIQSKKDVFGRGRLGKDEIVEALTNHGICVSNHNEADAYVVAQSLALTVEKEKP